MSTPAESSPSSRPRSPSPATGRSFRWLCPECRQAQIALLAEVQTEKSCEHCGKPSRVPRPPVGINLNSGDASRLPVGLAIEAAPKAPPVAVAVPGLEPAAPPERPQELSAPARRRFPRGAAAMLIVGLLVGAIGHLVMAGWRDARGAGGGAAMQAELDLVQTQWRLAEISRDRIEKDYRVSLGIYQARQASGEANAADRIAATQRAIADEQTKIETATAEMAARLQPLLGRFREDGHLLDPLIAAAPGARGARAAAMLSRLKAIFQKAPPEAQRWPAYLTEALRAEFIIHS